MSVIDSPSRCRRTLTATVISTLVATLVVALPAMTGRARAGADPVAVSAFLLRNGAGSVYRQNGLQGTEVRANPETMPWQGTDYPTVRFSSGSLEDRSLVGITMSSGLEPGKYTASRIPGEAQAIVDTDGFDECSTAASMLVVTRAVWADDGTPIVLDADFESAGCQSATVVHGTIRWNSDTPFGVGNAAAFSTVPGSVVVNSSADLPVTVTAAGNAPTVLGSLSVEQKTLSDGTQYWSVASDSCSGRTLEAGTSCTITMHIAPLRPNGYPDAQQSATLVLPDGQPDPVRTTVAADVAPLGGQPLFLRAVPGVRRVTLSWSPPQALGNGWTGNRPITYRAFLRHDDGTETEVRSVTGSLALSVPEPDGFQGTFVVRANEQGTSFGPPSVPVVAASADREVLVPENQDGLAVKSLEPDAAPSVFVGPYSGRDLNDASIGGLSVARDQSLLAYTHSYLYPGATRSSRVVDTEQLTGSVTMRFQDRPLTKDATVYDSNPSVSPDGSHVVFVHASGGVRDIRVGSTGGAGLVVVPGSSTLTEPTFTTDGRKIVAVRTINAVTDLVTVDPSTGAQTPMPNTTGLSQPDVAGNGRVVAVRRDTVDGTLVSELVTFAPGGVPTLVAGTDSGWNTRPRFSTASDEIFFGHASDAGTYSDAYSVDPASGVLSSFTEGGGASTPFVLTRYSADVTAPSVTMTGPTSASVLTSTVTASWAASESAVPGAASSGVATSDVRYRTASYGGAFSAYVYPAAWQATTLRSATMPARGATEYCFSARVRDHSGNVSAWTPDRCTSTPIDDTALTTAASRIGAAGYYLHTVSRAAAARTAYSRPGVSATRVGVLVTTCHGCGAVDVWVGKTYLGRVSTAAASTHYQQVLWLPVTKRITGTLLLRSVTSAQVLLDGVLVGE